MSGVPPQQPQQPPPQNNTTTDPGQPTSPPKGQPTQNVIWANQSGPSSKQVWEEGWKNFKLGIQAFLASQKARNQAAQQRARAFETNRGNGNCPNCGSPNVILGTHSDGGNGGMMLIAVVLLLFTCGLSLILMALSKSKKTGRYCRCLHCGQQWSA
jgi:hypothetical protein